MAARWTRIWWVRPVSRDARTSVVGAGVILIPKFPLVQMILLSQVLNGILLPFVLIFMVLLINKVDIMGEWTNSRTFNLVSWATVVIMIGLTLALVGITVRGMH